MLQTDIENGCAVLISIHPEHVQEIIAGKKIVEYRKVRPRRDISFLVLYCTAPVKKITAVVEVNNCLVGSVEDVWNHTSHGAGIPQNVYLDYYEGKQNAIAFFLGEVYQMERPMGLSDLPGRKTSPQSFCYLDDADMEVIAKRKSTRTTTASCRGLFGEIHGIDKNTFSGMVPTDSKPVMAES